MLHGDLRKLDWNWTSDLVDALLFTVEIYPQAPRIEYTGNEQESHNHVGY